MTINYIEADDTGSAASDTRLHAPQWPPHCDVSTGSVADVWRWLFKHTGTGSNILSCPELDRHTERTAADNLRRVLEIMKPSVKDLASWFGVSRQTIYNWLNGDEPKAEQVVRLRAFANVADIIAAENVADPGRLLKRAGIGGASLWDHIKEGGDIIELSKQLLQLTHVEQGKMRKLNAKFANRPRGDDGGELTPRLDDQS